MMKPKQNSFVIQFVMLALLTVLSTGCASFGKSLKNFISGRDSEAAPAPRTPGVTRYSENENVRTPGDRQYKRMNRQKFEEEAELKADAGSLWVMEGQGAYLFSQNQIRMVGDLLNVKIEGSPKTQLQTKVKVISKLLERLENPGRGLASQNPAQAQGQPANPQGQPAAGNPQAQNADGKEKTESAAAPGAEAASKEPPFAVQSVPTRIVEQLKDGSYRVRGMQPFMIGKREYKVIVTGVIRPEDFDDGGVDASRLLDPQFDIVSSRKGAAL